MADEPLRQRDASEDQEPISTHEVSEDRSTVQDTYHNPGQPNPDADAAQATQDAVSEAEEREEEFRKNQAEDRKYVPAVPVTTSPELNYATRDNIVHPGPVGAAVFSEKVAEHLLSKEDGVRVDVDAELLGKYALEVDGDVKSAAEVHEQLRDEVDVDEDALRPVSGPV